MLAGCMSDGGSGYRRSSYDSRSYEDNSRQLGSRARAALAEGCRQRFSVGTNKYNECVRGERKSDDSLVEGCTRLYKNDPKNYRRCMAGD
ncbi:hypothetical protein [Azospirillum sp. sgz301742]